MQHQAHSKQYEIITKLVWSIHTLGEHPPRYLDAAPERLPGTTGTPPFTLEDDGSGARGSKRATVLAWRHIVKIRYSGTKCLQNKLCRCQKSDTRCKVRLSSS
jgi:hypothetical protein